MSSKVGICNWALAKLSAERITDLDADNTVSAKRLRTIYEEVAEAVMSLGPWPSTIRRASLARLSDEPTYEFAYAFQLPTNPKCLRVLEINEWRPGAIAHRIENNQLLCDETSVDIKYIAYITDSEQYDTFLKQAIVNRLVAEIAYATTGQMTIAEKWATYADKKQDELLTLASLQGSSSDLPSDTFLDVRE